MCVRARTCIFFNFSHNILGLPIESATVMKPVAMNSICQDCKKNIYNQESMSRMWSKRAGQECDLIEGKTVSFSTDVTRLTTSSALSCPFCSFLLQELQHRFANKREWGVVRLDIWLGFDSKSPHAFNRMYVMDDTWDGGSNGYEVYTTSGKDPHERDQIFRPDR